MSRYPAPEIKDLPEDNRARSFWRWRAGRPNGAPSSPTTMRSCSRRRAAFPKATAK
jgi:hypothetical protein